MVDIFYFHFELLVGGNFLPLIPFGFPGLVCLTTAFLSGTGIVNGLRNLKIGLNYKAHLEQQINCIDQIIEYIEMEEGNYKIILI